MLRANDQREIEFDIAQQILDFQNRLVELIAGRYIFQKELRGSGNEYTKDKVRVVSLPTTPFKFEVMKESALQILDPARPEYIVIAEEPKKEKFKQLRKRVLDNEKETTQLPDLKNEEAK